MKTALKTEVSLADAVYNISRLAQSFEDGRITEVHIETSDQGEWLTTSYVTYVNHDEETLSSDGELLEDTLGDDLAVSIEDWAQQLSWDDARYGAVPGWHTVNSRGGYYYIDVEEALKADPPVEVKPVDLIAGVLGLHRLVAARPSCECGALFTDPAEYRQHVAEKIVEVLS